MAIRGALLKLNNGVLMPQFGLGEMKILSDKFLLFLT